MTSVSDTLSRPSNRKQLQSRSGNGVCIVLPSTGTQEMSLKPSSAIPLEYVEESSISKLAELATEITSPRGIVKRRSVTFDKKYLPPECNLDMAEQISIYHNGKHVVLDKARRKPGQTGYQICVVPPPVYLAIDDEQPYKIVVQEAGSTFVFAGANDKHPGYNNHSTEFTGNVVSLSPIKREQLLRLRMDIELDPSGKNISAFLLSAGKKPSPTALLRLHGVADKCSDELDGPVNKFVLIVSAFFIIILALALKPPLDNLYAKYRISHSTSLISTVQDLVHSSRMVSQEFGEIDFDSASMFDYHVDLLQHTTATFMFPFRSKRKGISKNPTSEWELEGTKDNQRDDEISVKFDGEFLFGEVAVSAYRVSTGGWHISDLNVDLYRKRRNYADTMVKWLVGWVTTLSPDTQLSIQIEENEHLRVSLEIGHDSDADGDHDEGANRIIQEKTQLIVDRRVVGYIRPDDDNDG